MARSQRRQPQPAQLSIVQVKASIPKLERRIQDLETFEIDAIRKRWDPIVESLCTEVNETLKQIFGHGTADYFQYEVKSLDTLSLVIGGRDYSLSEVHEGYRQGIERNVLKLRALKKSFEERIEDEGPAFSSESSDQVHRSDESRRVFVVHGRDDGAKEAVARYLEKLDLEAVILHEQANQGMTIIEKFEDHSDVAYAVVLLTPDDEGYPVGEPDQVKPRARQNAVLELGFFMGALGRKRVCVLYKRGVEIPSNYAGVLYVEFDEADWRLAVATEMKRAGIEIDLNKAI